MRPVELPEDPQRARAGAPDQGEDGIVGRGIVEPAEALGQVGGRQAQAAAVEAAGRLGQLVVGRAGIDREKRLLERALVEDDDQGGHPLADLDQLDAADPGRPRLGGGRQPSRPRRGGEGRGREAKPLVGGKLHLAELVADHQLLDGWKRHLADQRLHVEAVADVRRDAPRRRVRVPEEALDLQLGQDVAHGGGAHAERVALNERLGADRRGRRDVFLDDGPQDRLRPGVERSAAAADSSHHGRAPLAGGLGCGPRPLL